MNRLLLLLLWMPALCRAQTPTATADQADARIGSLINAADYETLATELPFLRDSVTESLRTLAEALAEHRLGHFARSNAAIDHLNDYAEELGDAVLLGMQNFAYYNYRALEDYTEAGRAMRRLVDACPEEEVEARATLRAFERWMEVLDGRPPVTVLRPEGDTQIPVEIRRVGRGEHLTVDGTINGVTEPFIFDTGCSYSNFISEAAAERLGVRILADSIPMTGMRTDYARVGVADSLRIGPVLILHPTFVVARQLSAMGDDNLADAVLGTDILRALGEIRIEPAAGRIVLPATPSPAPASNLRIEGGQYHLIGSADGEPLTLHFDTGNVRSDLSGRYFERHRDRITALDNKTTTTHGGFGGIRELEVYTLPQLTVEGTGRPVTLQNVTVCVAEGRMDADHASADGSLGADFVTACDAVTIDLGRMFVKTE